MKKQENLPKITTVPDRKLKPITGKIIKWYRNPDGKYYIELKHGDGIITHCVNDRIDRLTDSISKLEKKKNSPVTDHGLQSLRNSLHTWQSIYDAIYRAEPLEKFFIGGKQKKQPLYVQIQKYISERKKNGVKTVDLLNDAADYFGKDFLQVKRLYYNKPKKK